MTTDAAEDRGPSRTPDGTRLLFTSTRGGLPHLYWQNADGTGAAERFLLEEPSGLPVRPNAWTNDGKTLLVTFGRFGNAEIGTVNVDGERRVTALIAMPSSIEATAALSPDGRWIAYQSSLSGTLEVYVERFPELGDRQKISINGGTAAQWSADGRELFYLSPGGRVVAVPMSTGPKLVPGTPQTLFEGPFLPMGPRVRPFDVMPDGRFILIKEAAAVDPNAAGSIVVVQNWVEELKRLVPTR